MSNTYLFVAEADKIQDLLFRSSKLREVAGGSQLLTEFCEENINSLIEKLGLSKECKSIISAGGSFRICFDSKEKAGLFGQYLSEFYRRELGGTITIAEHVEVITEKEAISQAQENLRKAKHSGKLPVSAEQMPYMALCASCGVGIARDYKKRHKDQKENYICELCEKKSEAKDHIKEKFLSGFMKHITSVKEGESDFLDVEEIAKLEPRNYVAYIIADVNNMGMIFSSCDDFSRLEKLSDALDDVIQESLAEPANILIKKQGKDNNIPILPLILGGDDVFVLIPAKWALDFTRRFSQKFEENMRKSLENLDINVNINPTISAAVVVCKRNFPYQIAHNIGEELLDSTKRAAKEKCESKISFKIITGNEVIKPPEKEKKFVAGFPAYSTDELKSLIEYRSELKYLGGTRRAQLENLFHKAEDLEDDGKKAHQKMVSEWIPEREYILERLDDTQRNSLKKALKELGDENDKGNWIFIENTYYHKLPDLLAAWDFAHDIEEETSVYEEVKK